MRLLSLATLALAALPTIFASEQPTERDAVLEERGNIEKRTYITSSGSCGSAAHAACYVNFKEFDNKKCACKSLPLLQLWPGQPYGGLLYSTCNDKNIVAKCWDRGGVMSLGCTCVGGSSGPKVCTWLDKAICHCKGKTIDDNCNCVSGSLPNPPGGSTDCKDPNKVATCWEKGWGCNKQCVCVDPKPKVCTWLDKAICHCKGQTVDKNCKCVSGTLPNPPGGPSDCKDPNKVSKCWEIGWGCNKQCVCVDPNPPKTCNDWVAKARCHCKGMKTDGNCNCISGSDPNIPGPGTTCKDPNSLAKCWSVGLPCNNWCVCLEPPPTVGKCLDIFKIISCACKGMGVNPDCSCNACDCWDQWACKKKGGTLDNKCKCILPSRSYKRRDQVCPAGLTMCKTDPVKDGFECVDTQSNLESCGGCTSTGTGQDCSAIDGVADVACIRGKCVVSSCLHGRVLNGSTCAPRKVSDAPLFLQQGFAK